MVSVAQDAGAEGGPRDSGVVPPDGSGACPAGACNYQTLAGCAAGETCGVAIDDGGVIPACRPAGAVALGQPCAELFECAPGGLCVGGVCRRLCCGGDWTACPAGEGCAGSLLVTIGEESIPTGADLCVRVNDCDPLDPTACSPGRACQVVDERGSVGCAPAGPGGAGEPCSPEKTCAPGHTCRGGEAGSRCVAFCGLGNGARPCEAGECVAAETLPAGVGLCAE